MSELSPIQENYYAPIQKEWVERSGLDIATFKREASFAMQIMSKNQYLQTCSKESILKAVLNVAQTGLTLNPVSKYAYLIPRSGECILDPSYTGLVKSLTDSGSVVSINCQLVYQGDNIQIDMTSDKKVVSHIPYIINGNPKGTIKAVYSVATLHDGSFHCEIMSRADVEEVREYSESYKAYKDPNKPKVTTCIWVKHEGEMFRKTCIKRHFKHLPKTDRLDKFNKALELSNHADGFNEEVGYQQIGYIEFLIDNSILTESEKDKFRDEIVTIEYVSDANKMIKYLQNHQLMPGVERDFGSQKEIMQATADRAARDK